MKKELIVSVALTLGLLSSCEKGLLEQDSDIAATNLQIPDPEAVYIELPPLPKGASLNKLHSKSGTLSYTAYMAEYITTGQSDLMGRTVFFTDRGNKQLAGDFVPALALDGSSDISYYVDGTRPSDDLPLATTEAAIDRAMSTWDGEKCSDLNMTKFADTGMSTGFIAALLGYGGSFGYFSDITHSGWLPREFFDMLSMPDEPPGGDFILGVTFTIVFTDENGNLVDTDNNGKYDVAWREIYYNDNFEWKDGSTYDVETIALHEAGHGLSQAHFGSAFITNKNGKLHFAPRAVMNAAYSGRQTRINKTDQSGHCSNWSAWPSN